MSTQTFNTGAVRDAQGPAKLRFDLISPVFEEAIAKVLTDGATKYGERNWEKGMPFMRCVASIRRHLHAWIMGEGDEDHLAHLACNVMFLKHFEEAVKVGVLPASLDDRPECQPETLVVTGYDPETRSATLIVPAVGSQIWAEFYARQGRWVRSPYCSPGEGWAYVGETLHWTQHGGKTSQVSVYKELPQVTGTWSFLVP